MFQLIKGMGMKTIAIIVVTLVIALLCTVKYLRSENKTLSGEKIELNIENGIVKQNLDYVEKSHEITNKVVDEAVTAQRESTKTTETLRRDNLNEYVNKINAPTKVGEPDGADRVRVLARGLHENYCRARPKDARCITTNINP